MPGEQTSQVAESQVAESQTKNNMKPPIYEDGDYETYKADLQLWQHVTDVPKENRAITVHLTLKGKMKKASLEVGIEVLKTAEGMEKLIERLDLMFLQNIGIRQFNAYNALNTYRRPEETSMKDFLTEFEQLCHNLKSVSITLPDVVKAFILLQCCNLSENNRNLVMSGLPPDITYKAMSEKIQQVFGHTIGLKQKGSNHDIKDGDKSQDVLYTKNYGYNRGRGNSRGGRPGRGRGGRNGGYQERYNGNQGNQAEGGRPNRGRERYGYQGNQLEKRQPEGLKYTYSQSGNPFVNGYQSRCYICGSVKHWASRCPQKDNGAMYAKGNDEDDDEDEDIDDYVMLTMHDEAEGTEDTNFTMSVGCTGESVLVNSLVEDSRGCGILDSGCTKTVCGERWLKDYLERLSDHERASVKEETSPASFTFGDGMTVKSKKKITLPCIIGGLRGKVVTDVVNCDIPLLLSKRSMKNIKMILNFKNDSVKIGKRNIKLQSTSSGHYALPLSL